MRQDPAGVLGNLPEPGQRAGLTAQLADVVKVLEGGERRRGMESERTGRKAEPHAPPVFDEAGEAHVQMRSHSLAVA
jgi:hypothetical protein